MDSELVGYTTKQDLQRVLDSHLDLSDAETGLLTENLCFVDGSHRNDIDYSLLLLLLSEPLPRANQALSAGMTIMKKMAKGADIVGLRRMISTLFRHCAAYDSYLTGLVPIDIAEKTLKEECHGVEIKMLTQLSESFLDRASDCVLYPELISFLSSCSLWHVMHRLHTLDAIRQKQGYHFGDFLKISAKKGTKMDHLRLMDHLLGLGIILPETSLTTIFMNFSHGHTGLLDIPTFVATLEDAGSNDPEKVVKHVRLEATPFVGSKTASSAGMNAENELSLKILKEYDDRVCKSVERVFDLLDEKVSVGHLPPSHHFSHSLIHAVSLLIHPIFCWSE